MTAMKLEKVAVGVGHTRSQTVKHLTQTYKSYPSREKATEILAKLIKKALRRDLKEAVNAERYLQTPLIS